LRLSLRFVIPLLLALAAFTYAMLPLVDRTTVRWFVRDLDNRADLVVNAIHESAEASIESGDQTRLLQLFARITADERVYAMGYCPSASGHPVATPTMPRSIECAELDQFSGLSGYVLQSPSGPLLVSVKPLATNNAPGGRLVLVHDMSLVERRSEETRRYLFGFFVGIAVVVSLITVIVAELSWRGWEQGVRALLRGEGLFRPSTRPELAAFRPIAKDLRALIRDIEAEQHTRNEDLLTWTPDTLKGLLHGELRGQEVIVVSNREPYIHLRRGDHIAVQRPASGLVTAMEPIMRACSGTWVAHGSGTADRDVVDARDRVGIPIDRPAYQLRRVWLSPEEEAGYYYGFATRGCGHCVISRMCGRPFGHRTGNSIAG
jgi:trehalose 6-phosphate synthase